ncbi:MAG TPA: molybdopterin-dependent oxidoreductase, partial [Kiritimatiellia bacterium]|nr:molybdopterin-dependent oxidoreductase [Kiritimatiellia bacterium]
MGPKRKIKSGHVGADSTRVDAPDKVRGRAVYTDDIDVPGCWYGKVVRSPVAHGRLRSLKRDEEFDWSRVSVVLPDDIPGKNIADLFIHDMPFIAHDEINYLGEPLALVAAPDRELAEEAARHFHPDIEELPGIFHMEEIVDLYKKQDSSLHSLGEQTTVKGDIEKGFSEADMIVTGEYWAGYQEQLYIEPQAMIAEMTDDGGVFIRGSLQCPYFINPELCLT